MCGALVAAESERLVFGARDLRSGAIRNKFQLADFNLLDHKIQIEEGSSRPANHGNSSSDFREKPNRPF